MTRRLAVCVLAMLTVLIGACGSNVDGDAVNEGNGFVKADAPQVSPSGQYTAHVNESGDLEMYITITDNAGSEVFRDTDEYSTSRNHPYGIKWLSSADQLWIDSKDVGTAHIDRTPDGRWIKTAIGPSTRGDIPEEVREWSGR